MERSHNLEIQAIAITDTAKFLLQKPNQTHDGVYYIAPYGPLHKVELLTDLYTMKNEPYLHRKYLIISEVDTKAKQGDPILEINLHNFEEYDDARVSMLPKKPLGASNELISLVQGAVELSQGNIAKKDEVTELHARISAEGAIAQRKGQSFTLDDNSKLWINSMTLQGPPEHYFFTWMDKPEMHIRLVTNEQTIHFEKVHGGNYETYTSKNYREHSAGYAKPEDVTRDEMGNIVGGIVYQYEDKVVIDGAARAMGLRALRKEYCDPIEAALHKAKRLK